MADSPFRLLRFTNHHSLSAADSGQGVRVGLGDGDHSGVGADGTFSVGRVAGNVGAGDGDHSGVCDGVGDGDHNGVGANGTFSVGRVGNVGAGVGVGSEVIRAGWKARNKKLSLRVKPDINVLRTPCGVNL